MTSTLGLPPALLTWEDPNGFTVKLTQTETLLSLPFTAVNDSYSGKDYRCVITQSVTEVHFGVSYKPQVIVKPNDPLVLGVLTSYKVDQDVDLKCLVSGGYPVVKEVDFHCDSHTDQEDETDADGNLISSLRFQALMSDHNTTCICRGFNGETYSREITVCVSVFQEGEDDSILVTVVVPVVVTLLGVIGTALTAYIITVRKKGTRLTGEETPQEFDCSYS
ncbi:uncharacterized protein [Littorina saxatilis]|uniref:uncharacterized protein n=1 Tax=Littorina saxatilis TaxID=31220 RepID=UPI0038B4DB4D